MIEVKHSSRQYTIKTSCATYQILVDNIKTFGADIGITLVRSDYDNGGKNEVQAQYDH